MEEMLQCFRHLHPDCLFKHSVHHLMLHCTMSKGIKVLAGHDLTTLVFVQPVSIQIQA